MNNQSGFGLIELLIVILIIGILSAITIPLFFGQAVRKTNDIALQDLDNALKIGKTVHDASIEDNISTINSATFVATINNYDNQFIWTDTELNSESKPKSIIMSATNDEHWFTVCNRTKSQRSFVYCARQADSQDLGGGKLKVTDNWQSLGNNQIGEPRPNIDKSTGCTQEEAIKALSTFTEEGIKTNQNAFGWVHNLPNDEKCE